MNVEPDRAQRLTWPLAAWQTASQRIDTVQPRTIGFVIQERAGRLFIVDARTGQDVYSPPDQLRRPSYPWWSGPPRTSFTLGPPRGGGSELHQLWVLLNAFEAQHEHVRANNRALMLFKQSWMASELDVVWIVPPDTRTILYTF